MCVNTLYEWSSWVKFKLLSFPLYLWPFCRISFQASLSMYFMTKPFYLHGIRVRHMDYFSPSVVYQFATTSSKKGVGEMHLSILLPNSWGNISAYVSAESWCLSQPAPNSTLFLNSYFCLSNSSTFIAGALSSLLRPDAVPVRSHPKS